MEKHSSPYCGCLYFSTNALSRIMTKMADEEFTITGLSSSYAFLLMVVNNKPGVQPKEIGQQMQLTPSTITRLIEKLEQKKLVERKTNGRTTEVYPTDKGLQLEPKIKEAWMNLFHRYTELLGKEEGEKLTSNIYDAVKILI
ncbi:MAG: winged helix-turn-helix transcriptional regulator [Saprospiraceae bacterium]|nr:winged helix-turn-helix transcriptional regulator [Saprospiraceae bacterium]